MSPYIETKSRAGLAIFLRDRGGFLAEREVDALRGRKHVVAQRGHPLLIHILGGARHADRGDGAARGIVDRRGDAADPVLVFLEVERAARRDIADRKSTRLNSSH